MPETDGPLLTLGQQLRCLGPPSLAVLVGILESTQDYEAFVALVREFLPERETEILRQSSPAQQIAAFVDRFQDRYFPLNDNFKFDAQSYSDLLEGIPVMPMGVSYGDYHEMTEARPGLRLMTYLLADPYEGQEGARVALAEACADDVPVSLLERVPDGGLTPPDAHRLLDGTDYEALAHWADMLASDTENYFLDMDYEWLWEQGLPPWDRETVDNLTQEWAQADNIRDKVFKLVEWLEEDLPVPFGELLDFIALRQAQDIEQRRQEEDATGH